jgi:hypothetical protein
MQLDPDLVLSFRSGDVLNLVRTDTADIGISLVRAGQLIFAAGAATMVPVGEAISILGGPVLNHAAIELDRLLREDRWVEVAVSGMAAHLRAGDETVLGNYRISVLRCFQFGIPGKYECLAVSLKGTCDHATVVRSAERLASPGAGLVLTNEPVAEAGGGRDA